MPLGPISRNDSSDSLAALWQRVGEYNDEAQNAVASVQAKKKITPIPDTLHTYASVVPQIDISTTQTLKESNFQPRLEAPSAATVANREAVNQQLKEVIAQFRDPNNDTFLLRELISCLKHQKDNHQSSVLQSHEQISQAQKILNTKRKEALDLRDQISTEEASSQTASWIGSIFNWGWLGTVAVAAITTIVTAGTAAIPAFLSAAMGALQGIIGIGKGVTTWADWYYTNQRNEHESQLIGITRDREVSENAMEREQGQSQEHLDAFLHNIKVLHETQKRMRNASQTVIGPGA